MRTVDNGDVLAADLIRNRVPAVIGLTGAAGAGACMVSGGAFAFFGRAAK